MRDSCRRGRRADLRLTGHSSLDTAVVRSVLTGAVHGTAQGRRKDEPRSIVKLSSVRSYVYLPRRRRRDRVSRCTRCGVGLWVTWGHSLEKPAAAALWFLCVGSTATPPSIAIGPPCLDVVSFTAAAHGDERTPRPLGAWTGRIMSNLAQALKIAGATVAVVAVGTAYVLIHEHRRKLKKERRAAAEAEGASGASADGRSSSYMSVDRLLKLLNELAKAAYTLIEQVRAVCTRKAAAALAHLLPFAAHVQIANSLHTVCAWHTPAHALARLSSRARSSCSQTRKMVHEKHVSTGRALETCVDELQKDFEAAMEAVMGSIRAQHGVTEQTMSLAMMQHQDNPKVAAAVVALREAMAGKPPPGYSEANKADEAEAAKQRVRRKNKSGKRG